jgi:nitroimidazol reductase NimA-like FMN-containing flavoprotein (pyridoxamine 5'-phosphate oxidase superfamily)
MRRHEREISDRGAIEGLLHQGSVIYLAMCDGDIPYVIPLSYGYDGEALYIHCGLEGRKLDVLRRNPRVCFVVDPERELTTGEVSCGWSFRYRSVVGEGTVAFVESAAAKVAGLDVLMRQHGGAGGDYTAEALAQTLVLRVDITSLTGKQSGY